MQDQIRVQMFGEFKLLVNGECKNQTINKSKKGVVLLQNLMLRKDGMITSDRLMELLWGHDESRNPENALKTLISRFRMLLNLCCPGLGTCIVARRGGYQFVQPEGMTADLFEFEEAVEALRHDEQDSAERRAHFEKILSLYEGELLADKRQEEWLIGSVERYHNQYIWAVYQYIALLKIKDEWDEIVQVCQAALEIDSFDERLHLELAQAMARIMEDRRPAKHGDGSGPSYRISHPTDRIQKFYNRVVEVGNVLDADLNAVETELREYAGSHGAFECEYPVFRDIFQLQQHNLDRLGASIHVAMIIITAANDKALSASRLKEAMEGLGTVLHAHLRAGDVICRYSSSQWVLMLPNNKQDNERAVLERLKFIFYQHFSEESFLFQYRYSLSGFRCP
ncbi:MAG: BTAD domain-containing putative transcriptional regulator [Eubacteriales bacterium]|nr:BTAD domain-containing putative transcriptional regulator [Eubacteriales bacterium]